MADIEYVKCYNCQSSEYLFYDAENGYNLVKCQGCGLLYVNPRPSEGEIDLASITGMHRGDHLIKVNTRFNKNKIKKYIKILGEFYNPKEFNDLIYNWHDLGCGTGEFLIALREFSENKLALAGSEPNLQKVNIAKTHGLKVSVRLPSEYTSKFHYLSLLNVFSHLPDPIKILTEWKKLLYPGGELFIETGHSCHLPKEIHHRPYYLPDHLSFADKEIVISILERIGFDIVDVRIYRGEMYPQKPVPYLKYMAFSLMRGEFSMQSVLPQMPDRDMFIRARLR